MNDTTRKELREQVGGELVTVYTIGHNREVADLSDTADRIIALVTAARDAEIRELLLSDTVVMAAARAYVEDTFGEGTWSDMLKDSNPYGVRFNTGSPEMNIRSMKAALRAAIAAITAMPSGKDDNLQREISTWSRQTFGSTNDQVMRKLRNEYDELGREVQYAEDSMECYAMSQNPPEPSDFTNLIAPEAADVLFMLFQLAENFEFDLLEETRKKFEVNKLRTWERQPDGTYQHKEASNE